MVNKLPRYQSHKVVEAFQIGETNVTLEGVQLTSHDGAHMVTVSIDYYDKHAPKVGGYYVRYEDGYESFSPAKAFESGYTRIQE